MFWRVIDLAKLMALVPGGQSLQREIIDMVTKLMPVLITVKFKFKILPLFENSAAIMAFYQ